jgi:zinc/manganese transport system permease protein
MTFLFELKWMLIPFLACLVLSINHVYLGIHVIARKVIFVDLALAQIAALGATYALTAGYDPYGDSLKVSFFSLAFTFVGAGAFALARMRKERVPQEAFIGIIYAAASAAAVLMLSKSATGGEELKHMLVGDLLLVSPSALVGMAVLYGFIGLFHFIFRKPFLAISLDPEAAEASGISIRFWDTLFYMSFGVVIVKSVAIVGVLLVFSYLVVPAVIAQMWSDTISGRLFTGWGIAILASTLGIVWSFQADYPTGPAIVVMLSFFLVVSGILYYVHHAPVRKAALLRAALLILFAIVFVEGLPWFRKTQPVSGAPQLAPLELLLMELKDTEESHQLDGVVHLGDLHDRRIVPALEELLKKTSSEQVVEAIVDALGKQQDARAVPVLREAAARSFDDFMKVSIARSQLALGDNQGFQTLIHVLRDPEAAFARNQASDLLEQTSGRKFGYAPDRPLLENQGALKHIEDWWKNEGARLKWNPQSHKFFL